MSHGVMTAEHTVKKKFSSRTVKPVGPLMEDLNGDRNVLRYSGVKVGDVTVLTGGGVWVKVDAGGGSYAFTQQDVLRGLTEYMNPALIRKIHVPRDGSSPVGWDPMWILHPKDAPCEVPHDAHFVLWTRSVDTNFSLACIKSTVDMVATDTARSLLPRGEHHHRMHSCSC